MKTLKEQIEELVEAGYSQPTAQAKAAHDAVLLAMHKSGFKTNSTVKGGVVMSSLTHDVRRATMDMDIDFVHHSISERSVRAFVRRLGAALPEVRIAIIGEVEDLRHEAYRGKRIMLAVSDQSVRRPCRTKIDIGVHTHEEMAQVEYSFSLVTDSESADLFVNSKEQIFTEKLASLLRFGFASHRSKDVFDMFFLKDSVDGERLRKYVDLLVYQSRRCKENSKSDLLGSLATTFASKAFMRRLAPDKVNWLGVSPEQAVEGLVAFLDKTL